MAPQSSASAIPEELLVHIFLDLDIASLVTCKRVCKQFADIILRSALVQYHIELAANCMQDGPDAGPSTDPATRLAAIRKHRRAWNTLAWRAPEVVPSSLDGTTWELVGGVVCAGSLTAVAFTQLPSPLRGIERKEWSVALAPLKVRDFTVDPSQDLLVVVDDQEQMVKVHLRTMSTGAPHPGAHDVAIPLPHLTIGEREYHFTLQISGSRLGLMVEDLNREMKPDILIWDWPSGQLEGELRNGLAETFLLLPDNLCLLGTTDEDEDGMQSVQLKVWDLAVNSGKIFSGPSNDEDDSDSDEYDDVDVPNVQITFGQDEEGLNTFTVTDHHTRTITVVHSDAGSAAGAEGSASASSSSASATPSISAADAPSTSADPSTSVDPSTSGAASTSAAPSASSPTPSPDTLPYLISLHYPTLQSRAHVESILIRAEPAPEYLPPPSHRAPFALAPEARLYVVSLGVRLNGNHDAETTVLLLPLWTIMHFARRARAEGRTGVDVPWSVWGGADSPENASGSGSGSRKENTDAAGLKVGARMLALRAPSEVWVCYSYGLKFAVLSHLRARGTVVRIYDLNPFAARRDAGPRVHERTVRGIIGAAAAAAKAPFEALGATSNADGASAVAKTTRGTWARMSARQTLNEQAYAFAEQVVSGLPARVATVSVPPSSEARWDAVMLSEDSIVLVSERQGFQSQLRYGIMTMIDPDEDQGQC